MTLGHFVILSAVSVLGAALTLRSRPVRRWLTPEGALPPFEPDAVVDALAEAAFAEPAERERALAGLHPRLLAHPLVSATLEMLARRAEPSEIRLQIDLIAHQRSSQLRLPSAARVLCGMAQVAAPIVGVLALFGMAAGILAPLAVEAAGPGLHQFAPLLAAVLALLVFRAHATGVSKRVMRREEMLYGLMLELAGAAADGLRGRALRARLRLVVYRDRALHLREAA
jgi:hypothetical protein